MSAVGRLKRRPSTQWTRSLAAWTTKPEPSCSSWEVGYLLSRHPVHVVIQSSLPTECRHQLKMKVVEIGKTYHELEAKMSGDGMPSLVNASGELKQELLDNLQRVSHTHWIWYRHRS